MCGTEYGQEQQKLRFPNNIFAEPDDISIQAAIAANDRFIDELHAIRDAAQGLTLNYQYTPPTR
jgi:hypothetical protein